jgi:hypothetical protein
VPWEHIFGLLGDHQLAGFRVFQYIGMV